MFIYFIRSTQGGPIKIGSAKDPARRAETFQDAHAYPLEILAAGTGGKLAEAGLHRRFGAQRIGRSEWFEPCDDLMALIESLPSWEAIQSGAVCPDLGPELKPDRQTEVICELWLSGYSYGDIGSLLDVTRQRAHQIVSVYVDTESAERPPKPEEPIDVAFGALMAEEV